MYAFKSTHIIYYHTFHVKFPRNFSPTYLVHLFKNVFLDRLSHLSSNIYYSLIFYLLYWSTSLSYTFPVHKLTMQTLQQMPFYDLSYLQLALEFHSTKTKYTELLANNNFHRFLYDSIDNNMLQSLNCRYYDEESFNAMAANKENKLSLVHCNLQSSFSKFGLLKANLSNIKHNFSETGVGKCGILANLFSNYIFEYKEIVNNRKGGVGIYFRCNLCVTSLTDLEFQTDLPIEDMWFNVNDSYIVAVIYRHPNNNIEPFIQLLENNIEKIINNNKIDVICGDLNLDLIQTNNPKIQCYLDVLMGNDFLPCITIPTRITDHSATIIDHINVFRPLREISNKIISGNLFIDVSDHLPNFIILEGYTHDFSINNRPMVRNYSEKFKALFKTKISEINWTEIVKSDNPDIAYSAFINKFQEEFNRCFHIRNFLERDAKINAG